MKKRRISSKPSFIENNEVKLNKNGQQGETVSRLVISAYQNNLPSLKFPETSNKANVSKSQNFSRLTTKLGKQEKKQPKQFGFWILIFIILLTSIGYLTLWQTLETPKVDIEGIVKFDGLARDHVTGKVNYAQIPPVGGPHNPIWQNCGVYDKPVSDENAVHSLEHGAVWITYQETLPANQLVKLQAYLNSQSYVILSPYVGLSSPIVLSAWGVQLRVDSINDPRLIKFIKTYKQGSQTPEPSASCKGGVGTPLNSGVVLVR